MKETVLSTASDVTNVVSTHAKAFCANTKYSAVPAICEATNLMTERAADALEVTSLTLKSWAIDEKMGPLRLLPPAYADAFRTAVQGARPSIVVAAFVCAGVLALACVFYILRASYRCFACRNHARQRCAANEASAGQPGIAEPPIPEASRNEEPAIPGQHPRETFIPEATSTALDENQSRRRSRCESPPALGRVPVPAVVEPPTPEATRDACDESQFLRRSCKSPPALGRVPCPASAEPPVPEAPRNVCDENQPRRRSRCESPPALGQDPFRDLSSMANVDAEARLLELLNRSSLEELMDVPHIGEKSAKLILKYRKKRTIDSFSELTEKVGISKIVASQLSRAWLK